MKNIFILLFGIAIISACEGVKKPYELPIMGIKQYKDTVINGEKTIDTIYHTIADFEFVDQDSNLVNNETFANQVYVADFFFTTCPTICPKMKQQMLRVYEVYKDNPEVGILSHSIDPKHDTVAVLHDFAHKLGVESNKWHFVTGDQDAIYDLAEQSYMSIANADEDAPGGYIHSGAFLLVDKQRRIRGVYDGTVPDQVDILINDIKRLISKPISNANQ